MKNYTYIRKPETIQAIQAFRDNQDELAILAPGIWPWKDCYDDVYFNFYQIPSETDESAPTVGIGKWLIKHEDGSLQVMTEEEFEKNYMHTTTFNPWKRCGTG